MGSNIPILLRRSYMTYPTTAICLCRDVPLDSSYDHQVTFVSQQAQASYFYSKIYKRLQDNTYQRVMNNRLRIQCTIAEAMACNYLFFSNNSHDNKTIYAFITGWEYVNEVTTEITYEIDVFQTFWFDVRLLNVFVEREHSLTDNIGDNLVEEGLATGEYMLDGYVADEYADDIAIVFWCTFTSAYVDPSTGNPVPWDTPGGQWVFTPCTGYYQNRTFNGLCPMAFRNTTTGAQQIASWLSAVTPTNYDKILSCVMMPRASILYADDTLDSYFVDISKTTHYSYLRRSDGQQIKNKKLYTSPYTLLYVTAFNGVNATYAYEYFNYPDFPDVVQFNIIGDVSPDPSQCAIPIAYKGVEINADEMITLTGFPQVSWNQDAFKAWLAQNASNIASVAIGVAGAVATGGASLAAMASPQPVYNDSMGKYRVFAQQANSKLDLGAYAGAAASSMPVVSGITSLLVGGVMAWKTAPQARGNNGKYLMHKAMLDHFGFYNKHIIPEYVTIIDDYFNLFGYATRKVKQPNITGRPYWNYVKTIGSTVDALGIPDPYLQTMNKAFNNGITFWHNPNNVGNYALDNRPT